VLLLIFGGLLIIVASVMDWIFRVRMTRAGQRNALLLGGAFNYSEYHRVRASYGWPAWPVYLMWELLVCGIALLIGGFLTYFGTHPHGSE